MKYLTILLVALLTGCSTTVPVVAKFPEVPKHLMVKCPQLNKVDDDAKLSDIAKTVTINYTEYYSCAVKNDAWIEWYQVQKIIFEGLK
jgi:hypothetical protein